MKISLEFKNTHLHYALLGLILVLALYLRLDNLGNVQNFRGDQARDYDVIMRWKLDGVFPYLGPFRSVSQDRTVGPGWFYTVAPALWLSNFNLAAGAATVAVIATLTIWLYWLWIWRATGSAVAALGTAAVFAFSAGWISVDRTLWVPHVIPFCVVSFALLIDGFERRPVTCLFLYLMLNALIPHWHATGFPVMIAAFPPSAWALWRARGRLREAPRREWLGWGAALAVLVVALYLPPVLHELKYHTGNLPNYLGRTFVPSPPQTSPLAHRLAAETDRLVRLVTFQAFFYRPRPWVLTPVRIVAALVAGLFCLLYGRMLWRDRWRVRLSPAYWAVIIGGFWLITVLKSSNIRDYFLDPVLAPPLVLAGWLVGVLLRHESAAVPRQHLARGMGWALLALGCVLAAAQAPSAWALHEGKPFGGFGLRESRKIAEYVVHDAKKKKFSLLFADRGQNSALYMQVLVRLAGGNPTNMNVSIRQPVPRHVLGDELYLVLRGALDKKPVINGPAFDVGEPACVGDARIYHFPVAKLPPNLKSIFLRTQGGAQWFLDVQTVPPPLAAAPKPPVTVAAPPKAQSPSSAG